MCNGGLWTILLVNNCSEFDHKSLKCFSSAAAAYTSSVVTLAQILVVVAHILSLPYVLQFSETRLFVSLRWIWLAGLKCKKWGHVSATNKVFSSRFFSLTLCRTADHSVCNKCISHTIIFQYTELIVLFPPLHFQVVKKKISSLWQITFAIWVSHMIFSD